MRAFALLALLALAIILAASYTSADTPASCLYDEIRGDWVFHMGPAGNAKSINCSAADLSSTTPFKVSLTFPNRAFTEDGTEGSWTMVYNQGFEVNIAGKKFFAFSAWDQNGKVVTSHCDRTTHGWFHDAKGRDGNEWDPVNWGCYYGEKTSAVEPRVQFVGNTLDQLHGERTYKSDPSTVEKINKAQRLWKAKEYPQFHGMRLSELQRQMGNSRFPLPPKFPAETKASVPAEELAALPKQFDWRNISGVDYVSPVRNQGQCGSCYSFASMGMLESRVRIKSSLKQKPTFSEQNIVSCSEFSQGCDGGFAYLIGGKYGEDFGQVEEFCFPYSGTDEPCKLTCEKPLRWYSTDYNYVGGFYGGSSPELIMKEVYENGPVAVAFEVHSDFMNYHSGVYKYTGVEAPFNPLVTTNHAVLVTGWGETEDGTPYWIVKNSWGTDWGMDGYFWILRGVDEVGIESCVVRASPVLPQ